MTRILLARHGETAWNALGKLQGQTDTELNDTGREQARALAERLLRADAGVSSVWSSDLKRARQTAEIAAEVLQLSAPRVDQDLREMRLGAFEGLTREQCAERFPEAWAAKAPPNGEENEIATARLTRALMRVATSDTGTILVISHGVVMRMWLALHGITLATTLVDNGAAFDIEHDGTGFRVRLFSQ